jgi:hypothetical protein
MSLTVADVGRLSFGASRTVGGMSFSTPGKFQMLFRVRVPASLVVMLIDQSGNRAYYEDASARPAGDTGTLEIASTAFDLPDGSFDFALPDTLIVGIAKIGGADDPSVTFDGMKWLPDAGGEVLIDNFDSYGPATELFEEKWTCDAVFPGVVPGLPDGDACFSACGIQYCCVQGIQIATPALIGFTSTLDVAPTVDLTGGVAIRTDMFSFFGMTLRFIFTDGTGRQAGFDEVVTATIRRFPVTG